MGGYGGALKQLSIGCASSAGKAWIHSAGKTKDQSLLRRIAPLIGVAKGNHSLWQGFQGTASPDVSPQYTWARTWFRRGYGRVEKRAAALDCLTTGN